MRNPSAHFNFGSKVSSSPDKVPEMRGGNTRVMSEFVSNDAACDVRLADGWRIRKLGGQ